MQQMRLLSHQPDPGPSPVKTRAKCESDKKESPPSVQDGQDLFLKTIQAALEEDLVNRKCVHVLLLLDTVLIILYSGMIILYSRMIILYSRMIILYSGMIILFRRTLLFLCCLQNQAAVLLL